MTEMGWGYAIANGVFWAAVWYLVGMIVVGAWRRRDFSADLPVSECPENLILSLFGPLLVPVGLVLCIAGFRWEHFDGVKAAAGLTEMEKEFWNMCNQNTCKPKPKTISHEKAMTITVDQKTMDALDALIGSWKRQERSPLAGMPPSESAALCDAVPSCAHCPIARFEKRIGFGKKLCVETPLGQWDEEERDAATRKSLARATWEYLTRVRAACSVQGSVRDEISVLIFGKVLK